MNAHGGPEVKVLGWRKGERSGMVVTARAGRGAAPSTVRVGGRVPWGARSLPCGVRRHGPGLCDVVERG